MASLKSPATVKSPRDKSLAVSFKKDGIKLMDVLSKLEKHEAECNLRYQRINEKLSDNGDRLKLLDLKIWGLAVLIIIAPMVHKLLG